MGDLGCLEVCYRLFIPTEDRGNEFERTSPFTPLQKEKFSD